MTEGKPAKAHWWSRPRAQDAEAGPSEAARPAPHASDDGDYELRAPEESSGAPLAAPGPEATPSTGAGSAPTGPTEAPEGTHGGGTGPAGQPGAHDPEHRPSRPATAFPPDEPGASTGAPVPGAGGEGAAAGEPYGGVSEGAGDSYGGVPEGERESYGGAPEPATSRTGELGRDAAAGEAGPAPAATGGAATGDTNPAPAAAAAPVGDASPVLAAAAVAGDATPAPAAPAVVAAGGAPAADLGGAEGAEGERPKPLHDPDPYSTPPYGEPGPWAPAPPVQHPTQAHGMPGAEAPAPQPPHLPHQASAPVPAQTSAPVPAQAPAPHPAPAQAVAEPPAAPPAAPARATEHPALPHQQGAPPQQGAPYADGAPGPGGPQGPVPGPAPAAPRDPWQNYDPWAVAQQRAALQVSGAEMLASPQRRGKGRKGLVVGAVLLALGAGGVGGAVGAYLERNGGIGDVELPQVTEGAKGRAPDSVAGIAASALPGVVTLHVSGSDAQGTGTGFVLDKRGHILTNNHVVEPAGDDGEITVTFSGGETAEAEVVGRDSGYDLAVVRVEGVRGLKALPLGNSDEVQVGDPVVAIGAPFDLANTVTAGIISAKERPITAGGENGDASDVSYVDALQTDAPINPGNSGGPLVDANARVIGINSAIRSAGDGADGDRGQAGSIGLGFAIPINQGKRVAEELINTGKATHPVIGVTLDMDYGGDGARVGTEDENGSPVKSGGPADRAGIRPGDVITEVDGQRVHSGEELIVKIRAHRPGDRLELTLERDGGEREIALTLGSSASD